MTRLTNAFSKKFENHASALSLYFVYYNFCRPHQTLTKNSGKGSKNKIATTPAMAAKLTERPWTIEELIQTVTGESK
jgi:hypothetical protein